MKPIQSISEFDRRTVLKFGAALAVSVFQSRFAHAFPSRPGETVIPWLDQPAPNPVPAVIQTQLVWEDLDSWVTPNDKFFSISHFDRPIIDANAWKLEIDGLVKKPMSLTLADLKARPRKETVFTVEQFRYMASVPVDSADARYRLPLENACRTLDEIAGPNCDFVLLGSVATLKYLEPMFAALAARIA